MGRPCCVNLPTALALLVPRKGSLTLATCVARATDRKRTTEQELAEARKRNQQYEGDTVALSAMSREELHKLQRQQVRHHFPASPCPLCFASKVPILTSSPSPAQENALDITKRALDSFNETALKNTSAGPLPTATPTPGAPMTLELPAMARTDGSRLSLTETGP